MVRMTRPRLWQNAGREEYLIVGVEYDLPEAVAAAFVATGSAERVQPHEVREVAALPGAPEHAAVPVRKGGRR